MVSSSVLLFCMSPPTTMVLPSSTDSLVFMSRFPRVGGTVDEVVEVVSVEPRTEFISMVQVQGYPVAVGYVRGDLQLDAH